MYEKIVGKRVKVVHKDGDKISITIGIVNEWSTDVMTLCLLSERTGRPCYVHSSCIEKLELLEEEIGWTTPTHQKE